MKSNNLLKSSVTEIAGYIDQTLLQPTTTQKELDLFLEQALPYPFATLCIPPCYVGYVAVKLEQTTIGVGTVVGFPLGFQSARAKQSEAREAVEKGASEIDLVMNIAAFKSGEFRLVQDEIAEVVTALPGITVKVILETCYLNQDEKIKACQIVMDGGAHFVKTSTGFGSSGATIEDIRLLSKTVQGKIKVKASGGIKTSTDLLQMIEAGADRVGTSSGVVILEQMGFTDMK